MVFLVIYELFFLERSVHVYIVSVFLDSIEIERSADAERRLSLTLKSSGDIQSRILCDVTEQTLQSSAKKCASPGINPTCFVVVFRVCLSPLT